MQDLALRADSFIAVTMALFEGCSTDAYRGPAAAPLVPPITTLSRAVPNSRPLPTSSGLPKPVAMSDDSGPPGGAVVVQDEYLGHELELFAVPRDAVLNQPALSQARRIVRQLAREAIAKRWSTTVMTGCPADGDSRVIVEGRAVVRDVRGNVRAYAESPGIDDSAGVWKLYYDEKLHLRVATFEWRSVAGHTADGVMLFEISGRLVRCTVVPQDAAPFYCGAESRSDFTLDPAVTDVTQAGALEKTTNDGSAQSPAAWVIAINPAKQFAECTSAYVRRR